MLKKILIILLIAIPLNIFAYGPDVVIEDIKVQNGKVCAYVSVRLTSESLETNTLWKIVRREIKVFEEEENIKIDIIKINSIHIEERE